MCSWFAGRSGRCPALVAHSERTERSGSLQPAKACSWLNPNPVSMYADLRTNGDESLIAASRMSTVTLSPRKASLRNCSSGCDEIASAALSSD